MASWVKVSTVGGDSENEWVNLDHVLNMERVEPEDLNPYTRLWYSELSDQSICVYETPGELIEMSLDEEVMLYNANDEGDDS